MLVTETAWREELSGTKLPDARYHANLSRMCDRLSRNCGLSFSAACGPAVRKSATGLFSDEEVNLLSGHSIKSAQRCAASPHPYVFVLEDTTDVNYFNHKSTIGLGDLGTRSRTVLGLCVHSALAVDADRVPLGLLGQHIWAPKNDPKSGNMLSKIPIEQKESYKWLRVLEWIKEQTSNLGDKRILVVGDREGDFYEHFAAKRDLNIDLVIRLLHKRRNIKYEGNRLSVNELFKILKPAGDMRIKVSRKAGQKEREADLSIYYAPILCPPSDMRMGNDVPLWVVRAIEIEPPEGIEPIDWAILTTIPVENLDKAIWITEAYTFRWIIERFHYVLKQGLRIERLQFDTFTRLSNAINVCSIAAWSVLRNAYVAKEKSTNPVSSYFDHEESKILETVTGKKIETVKDHVMALGKLVGFQPSSKQPIPGEKLLWQANQILKAMKTGWNLAQNYGTG